MAFPPRLAGSYLPGQGYCGTSLNMEFLLEFVFTFHCLQGLEVILSELSLFIEEKGVYAHLGGKK